MSFIYIYKLISKAPYDRNFRGAISGIQEMAETISGTYSFGGVAQWYKGVGHWLADFPWYAPDRWLTCNHFVGKASAMGQPTRPTQPPTLSGTGNE